MIQSLNSTRQQSQVCQLRRQADRRSAATQLKQRAVINLSPGVGRWVLHLQWELDVSEKTNAPTGRPLPYRSDPAEG